MLGVQKNPQQHQENRSWAAITLSLSLPQAGKGSTQRSGEGTEKK